MSYRTYYLIEKYEDNPGVWIYRFKPEKQKEIVSFLPGQYVFMKNPVYKPDEEHPFSIASSPTQNDYLEFCIKTYGDWTEEFSKMNEGDMVQISEPQGSFVWDPSIKHPIFLLGGIGISPIMSMLCFAQYSKFVHPILILYGNKTPDSITYKQNLESMAKNSLNLLLVHIFSHISENQPLPELPNTKNVYSGFITKEIIENEVDFHLHPTFYIIGPPVFTNLMQKILSDFDLKSDQIRIEKLEEKTSSFMVQK